MAATLKPLPLSVQAGCEYNQPAVALVGKNKLELPFKGNAPCFWFLVIDRRTLEVVVNHVARSDDNDKVPAEVAKYAKSWEYILIFSTMHLPAWDLPTGALYDFLRTNGGGRELRAMERLFSAFGSGWYTVFGYCLVDVLGVGGVGLESMKYGPGRGVLLLTLEPTSAPDGGEWYVPVALSD